MSENNGTNNSPPQETLIGNNPPEGNPTTSAPTATGWQEYTPDPNKSDEENAAAKAEHDKTKPADEFVPLSADDIKMPEGMETLPEAQTEFLGILNNRDLSPKEQAQALIDLQAKVMKDASERASSLWDQQQTAWQEQIQKDPEFGGPKLDENLGHISNLIDQYGGDVEERKNLRDVFALTGAGNNPMMIRFLTRVGKAMAEGKPVSGSPPTSGPRSEADLAASLYPSMKK